MLPTKLIYLSYFIIFLLIMLSTSCQKEQVVLVDTTIQPYFDLFEKEGEARGRTIDLSAEGIQGILTTLEEGNVQGQCAVNNTTGIKTIRVDQTFWNTASNLEKEFLIFHELGHCYLDRRHLDETDSRGNCNSMMYTGNNVCKMRYTSSTRSTYLDELFQ